MKNSICLEGRFTRDPEMRTASNGSKYATFCLAHKQSQNAEHPDTGFYDCIAWREAADDVEKFGKGALVEVSGSLMTRSWKTKDGQNRKSVEIRVSAIKAVYANPAENATQTPKETSALTDTPDEEILGEDSSPVKLPWDEDND